MSINPVIACSMAIFALASAQGRSRLRRRVLCPGCRRLPGDPEPPIDATVWYLPSGAVDQNINGVTYFSYGGAYYRPIYDGSGVYYEVAANPA